VLLIIAIVYFGYFVRNPCECSHIEFKKLVTSIVYFRLFKFNGRLKIIQKYLFSIIIWIKIKRDNIETDFH